MSGFKSYPLPIQNPFPVVMGGVKGKIFEERQSAMVGLPTAPNKGPWKTSRKECDAIGGKT
ncbi:MAG: hypothetical protein CM15mP120_08620 [Pseudomonadota bacterium]|nr:MAG: hypothetical protein CM15mP120_08620 [Pseudomonadota bacterium]